MQQPFLTHAILCFPGVVVLVVVLVVFVVVCVVVGVKVGVLVVLCAVVVENVVGGVGFVVLIEVAKVVFGPTVRELP